jgi:hypothetical protein
MELWKRLALLGVPPPHPGRATATQSDDTQALACNLSTVLGISLCCPTEALRALGLGLFLRPVSALLRTWSPNAGPVTTNLWVREISLQQCFKALAVVWDLKVQEFVDYYLPAEGDGLTKQIGVEGEPPS